MRARGGEGTRAAAPPRRFRGLTGRTAKVQPLLMHPTTVPPFAERVRAPKLEFVRRSPGSITVRWPGSFADAEVQMSDNGGDWRQPHQKMMACTTGSAWSECTIAGVEPGIDWTLRLRTLDGGSWSNWSRPYLSLSSAHLGVPLRPAAPICAAMFPNACELHWLDHPSVHPDERTIGFQMHAVAAPQEDGSGVEELDNDDAAPATASAASAVVPPLRAGGQKRASSAAHISWARSGGIGAGEVRLTLVCTPSGAGTVGAQRTSLLRGLVPSTRYALTLRLRNAYGWSNWSAPTYARTQEHAVVAAPPPPRQLACSAAGATICWSIPNDATGGLVDCFLVQRSRNGIRWNDALRMPAAAPTPPWLSAAFFESGAETCVPLALSATVYLSHGFCEAAAEQRTLVIPADPAGESTAHFRVKSHSGGGWSRYSATAKLRLAYLQTPLPPAAPALVRAGRWSAQLALDGTGYVLFYLPLHFVRILLTV